MTRLPAVLLLMCAGAGTAAAQSETVSALVARGADSSVAASVDTLVNSTNDKGLPGEAVLDMAFEGLAMGVEPGPLTRALQDLARRLENGMSVARSAGLEHPSGMVVLWTTKALHRRVARSDVRTLLSTITDDETRVAGLTVVSAMATAGFTGGDALKVVLRRVSEGSAAADLLEIPSYAAHLATMGESRPSIVTRLLAGEGF